VGEILKAGDEWAHAPGEQPSMGEMQPGPFGITDMPVRKPELPPVSPQTSKLLKGLAAPTQGEE
jgi:hypothetical protein